jgi:nucleotidyltransferase substrate binding protein (TIGR01987 family)
MIMSKIHRQKMLFVNALARLREISVPQSAIERDAQIQRFEFTFDSGWKFLKQVLFDVYSVDAPTPWQAFQEAVRLQLIPSNEGWARMRDARNTTSHMYSERAAVAVSAEMSQFVELFQSIESVSDTTHK